VSALPDPQAVTRDEVIAALASAIEEAQGPHSIRVAIDGPDAAGKTTLANELAVALRSRGLGILRSSIDEFLRPSVDRYARGRESALGFFEDSFDYGAVRASVLRPLGAAAALIFDGIFLQRLELRDAWGLRGLRFG
jgi:uridine kinase